MSQKITGPFIVGFNGPPRSGKDTASQLFASHVDQSIWINAPVIFAPLAMPIRKMGFAALGLPYSFDSYEVLKAANIEAFNKMNLREWMIWLSEEVMKPKFGPDIWCRLWAESIPVGFSGIVLVPDVGFQIESNFMMERFGHDNVVMVQMAREGYDFSNDSRENVGADQNFAITNNGEIDDMRVEIARLAGRLTNQYRWQI